MVCGCIYSVKFVYFIDKGFGMFRLLIGILLV